MSNEPKAQPQGSHRYTGILRQESFKSQRPDAFQRLTCKLGATSVDNKPVWTNFKVYVQEPSLDHPLNIKIGMHNPSGKAFVQMPIHEFDQLLADMVDWRANHNADIAALQLKEFKLQISRDISLIVENSLSKSVPDNISINGQDVAQAINKRNLAECIQLIDALSQVQDPHQSKLIKERIIFLQSYLDSDSQQIVSDYSCETINKQGV